MKTKRFINVLLLANFSLLFSCKSQDTLIIKVKKDFCGEIFIIEGDSSFGTLNLNPDSNNIVMIYKELQVKVIKVYSGETDVSDLELLPAYGGSVNYGPNPNDYFTYRVLFIKCKDEVSNNDPTYWNKKFFANKELKDSRMRAFWLKKNKDGK